MSLFPIKIPTPTWALRDEQLREVLLAQLEKRFYIPVWKTKEKSLKCRLKQVREFAAKHLPSKHNALARLTTRLECTPENKKLRIVVLGLETDVYLCEHGCAETLCYVVYLCYRMLWNSYRIADELRLRNEHIRVLVHRLNKTAEKMGMT